MSDGRLIGDAYIAILPQLAAFRTDTESGIRRILGTMDPKVRVGANTAPFLAEVEAAKRAIESRGDVDLTLAANVVPMRRSISDVQAMVDDLRHRMWNIPVSFDDSKGLASLFDYQAALNGMDKELKKFTRDAAREGEDLTKAFVPQKLLRNFYGLEGAIKDFETKFAHIDPESNIDDIITKWGELRFQVTDLSDHLAGLKIDPNDFKAVAKFDNLNLRAQELAIELKNMPVDANILPMQAKISALIAEARAFQVALQPKGVTAVGTADAATQYGAVGRAIQQLQKDIDSFGKNAPPELEAVAAALADLKRRSESMASQDLVNPKAIADTKELASDTKSLLAAFSRIPPSAQMVAAANDKAATGFGILGRALAAIRNTDIPLFATSTKYAKDADFLNKGLTNLGHSFLTTATGTHILIEAIVELTAVWGPAIVGLTAFGLAAYPIAKNVNTQLTNMHTAALATGKSFTSMVQGAKGVTGQMNQFSKAVQPQVLQLWGDYLTLAGNNAGHFKDVLRSIGTVLDDFGAKIVMDLNSKQTSKFLEHAASDIKGLGIAFQEIGRIIGTVLNVVPGYAEKLLVLGDAALKVAADFTQFIAPVLKGFLALHGAIFYLGLAATLLLTFGRAAVTAFSEVAAGEAVTTVMGSKLSIWGAAIGSAAGSLYKAGRAAAIFTADLIGLNGAEVATITRTEAMETVMAAVPFGAMGLAALGVAAILGGAIAYGLATATNKAGAFGAQMQDMIAKSDITNLQANIATALQDTSKQLSISTQNVNKLAKAYHGLGQGGNTGKSLYPTQQLAAAISQQQQYSAQLTKIYGQYTTGAIRMDQLSHAYGGAAQAMAILNLAGVKQSDIATANGDAWALDMQKIKATAAAYGFMGQQLGQIGNQLDTLTIATGAVTQATQSLVSAEQGWLSLISGGESAFVTFEQGQQQLSKTLAQGSSSAATFTVRVGKLSEKYTTAGISMNGTTQAALAARGAFVQQIQAAGQLYGNLQMLAAGAGNTQKAQGQLTQAGKDLVAQMLQTAAGSKQATTLTYALAQMMGYTGKNSFAAMAKWAGISKGALADLDKQEQDLTAESATLSQAAKNLGNALINNIADSQSKAILSSVSFYNIQNKLIDALQTSHGVITKNAGALAGQYFQALYQAGVGTQQATQMTDALLQKMGASDQQIQQENQDLATLASRLDALHDKTVTVTVKQIGTITYTNGGQGYGGSGPGSTGPGAAPGGHAAAGAYVVRGSGPSGKDSTPYMLAPGELVINTSHAPKYTAMAKRDGIPGLSSGGMLSPAMNPAQASVTGPQMQPMTAVQGMTMVQLLQMAVKLLQQQPQALGGIINHGTATGARHAFWSTGG